MFETQPVEARILKQKSTLIRVLDYVAYLAVRFAEELVNILPERGALAFGRFLGRLVYVLLPDRREAALDGLTIAFGRERSRQWILRTARKSFEHLGTNAVEFFRIRRWSPEERARKIVIEGRLPFNLAMAPGARGICLVSSHFGFFEIMGPVAREMQMTGHGIVTGLRNPHLSAYFFSRGEGTGFKVYPHKGIVYEMIQRLIDGELVGFLADQRGDEERGIFVNFFGTRAPANEVFARFVIDGRAAVLPVCLYRGDDGRYHCVFLDEPQFELTGDTKTDLTNVSQCLHDLFEQWLRFKPEQGFWLHRKWKRKRSRKSRRKSRKK